MSRRKALSARTEEERKEAGNHGAPGAFPRSPNILTSTRGFVEPERTHSSSLTEMITSQFS